MASECMECVEGRAVALGLCADCLAGEPVEAVVRQIARLTRELEEARSSSDAEVRVVRLQKFDQVWSCVECGTLAMRYGGSDLPPCPCGGERDYTGDVALTMIVTMDDLRSMVERHSDDCGGEPPNGGGDDE